MPGPYVAGMDPAHGTPALFAPACFALAIVVATVTYHAIERPLLDERKLIGRTR